MRSKMPDPGRSLASTRTRGPRRRPFRLPLLHFIFSALRDFDADESGTQTLEVLMIFVAVLVPCFAATLLLEDVLLEYLEVTTILVTSPFF